MEMKLHMTNATDHDAMIDETSLIPSSYMFILGDSDHQSTGSNTRMLAEGGLELIVSSKRSNLHHIENAEFFIFLEGSFYLNQSATVQPEQNLKLFLENLSWTTLDQTTSQIAGGVFNLVVFSKLSGELHIINDRLAILPLFWMQQDKTLLITNNQLNFQNYTYTSRSALIEFMKYGYLPVSPALFEGVERLGVDRFLKASLAEVTPQILTQHGLIDDGAVSARGDHAAQWQTAFESYFNRVDGAAYLGLSGGYDSRLLAAYAAGDNTSALNFGDASSAETKIAMQIAEKLDMDLERDQFPQNAITQHAQRLQSEFRNPTSLENVHVLHLSDKVEKRNPAIYLDGYLGGAIMGDVYFNQRVSSLCIFRIR